MLTRENKYEVQKAAEILIASIAATKTIAVRTRIDLMDGYQQSQDFISALVKMENHLDRVLEQCERCI